MAAVVGSADAALGDLHTEVGRLSGLAIDAPHRADLAGAVGREPEVVVPVERGVVNRAAAAGLQSVGCRVIDLGMVATPTLLLSIKHHGAAGAIGPALQSIGISQGYYFFNAAPYILTLLIMVASAGSKKAARDAPGELSIIK